MGNELYHHGILGQKWGVRRFQNEDGSLTSAGKARYNGMSSNDSGLSKEDSRWVKRNSDKVTSKAKKQVSKEMNSYEKELLSDPNAFKTNGKVTASTINKYNQRMAELMTEKCSDITTPSGKSVVFVAKRSQVGVMMAVADQGYNMNQLKNGVWANGRVAYKSDVLNKYSS